MSLGIGPNIVLLVMLLCALPSVMLTRHNGGGWAYAPSSLVGLILILVMAAFLVDKI